MKRVIDNGEWTLFCPDETPGLADVYGEKFNELYIKYESQRKGKKTMQARDLWFKILTSQMETGTPYMLYKDACNKKSNQKNLGTIKSSNLCTEIIEYSDDKETAVCNLASLGLPKYVKEDKTFDYDKLYQVTKIIIRNLNKVIDINFYPTDKTRRSNFLHRPIGLGIQGLADVFAMMDVAFFSDEAKQINKNIFETIYYAAVEKSYELSKDRQLGMTKLGNWYKLGIWSFDNNNPHCHEYKVEKINGHIEVEECLEKYKPILNEIVNLKDDYTGAYSSFEGSPISEGIFQFDMWDIKPSDRYNWESLRNNIKQYGIRNSLLIAPMPTASTSQILGNNECFEPFTSNLYVRRTLAGEFICINKHLQRELVKMGKWNEDIKNSIIKNNGSIQQLAFLPEHIKNKYKIVWEIPMKHLLEMARDRGAFICQSQSLNLWMENPNFKALTAMHFFAWRSGLKTGLYYLRTKAKAAPQQFTIQPSVQEEDPCEMCSG